MAPGRAALAIAVLATSVAACVAIPQDVKQTFAPAGPNETSYFRRRPDAPSPQGFVAPAPPPASASALTPASTPDGGTP